jgi:citrate lyase subunit beta/citryl-CoA lyase/(S)-citramalyl-CoA lyase
MTYRSLLFVPGSRPERFAKAQGAGADIVCIDLEDAVVPEAKVKARAVVLAHLKTQTAEPCGIRINSLRTADGLADVLAVTEALSQGTPLAMLMVPKLESAQELALLRSVVGADCPPLWPIIESAEGLKAAWEICAAPGLGGVLFGGVDYAADLGSDMGWDALFLARSTLAVACARSGIGLLDVPYLDVADTEGLGEETMRVKAMGFQGRACIHPAQVAPVNAVFSPSAGEIVQAQRVLDAFAAAQGNAALLDGKMIELPVVRSAQRILDSAARAQNGKTI